MADTTFILRGMLADKIYYESWASFLNLPSPFHTLLQSLPELLKREMHIHAGCSDSKLQQLRCTMLHFPEVNIPSQPSCLSHAVLTYSLFFHPNPFPPRSLPGQVQVC